MTCQGFVSANGEFRKSLNNIIPKFKVEPEYHILNHAIFTYSQMEIRDDICWKKVSKKYAGRKIYLYMCHKYLHVYTGLYIDLHIQSVYLIPGLTRHWKYYY